MSLARILYLKKINYCEKVAFINNVSNIKRVCL